MMLKLFLFFTMPIMLFALEFKVASYNVENLFDTQKSGFEYKEYVPTSKSGWNDAMLSIKIKNLARVIKELDADILALQEVENKNVLKRLNLALGNKKYPYMYRSIKSQGIDCALLSRFPIKEFSSIHVVLSPRAIHRVVIEVEGTPLTLFLNHWPSYKNSNQKRMTYAKTLEKLYKKEKDFILLGDFNSPFLRDKNDWGRAVASVSDTNYNLWLEEPYNRRYSYIFYKKYNALDHIIISNSLYKNWYVDSSFQRFMPKYLLNKYGHPLRWQISSKGKGKHLGKGYSDHLPIVATFNTRQNKAKDWPHVDIKRLLESKDMRVNYLLDDVMVIDKSKFGAKLEDKSRNTIYFYQPDINLSIGEIYNLHVRELADYKGKREIILAKRIKK